MIYELDHHFHFRHIYSDAKQYSIKITRVTLYSITITIREGGCNLNSMPGAHWHYTEINLGLVCDLCTNSSNWDWSLKEAEEGTYVGGTRKWLISEGVRSLMLSMYDEKYSLKLKHLLVSPTSIFPYSDNWK